MSSQTNAKPPRIVVIEDNPADVRLLRFALDEQGEDYELLVLRDGEEALNFIEERRTGMEEEPEPCVIVLDLHLPKYDGAAVLKALKRDPVLTHIRVAVLTTMASPEEEAAVLGEGVRLYKKPRELDEFMQLGKEILALCKDLPAETAASA